MKLLSLAFIASLIVSFQLAEAGSGASCVYQTESGAWRSAHSVEQVPEKYRSNVRCQLVTGKSTSRASNAQQVLAAPVDINLKGAVREETISSNLGIVHLRWPRKLEVLFGRTPQRAMSDAINTASKVLRANSFPAELQSMRQEWQVVFMDEELPTAQIPTALVSNCHPAWMTPPANIYVVGQRVVAGCGNNEKRVSHTVADAQLTQVLLHEIGHAIESQLLGDYMNNGDRQRAEGFASWFEQYSAEYSSVIPKGSAKNFYLSLARQPGAGGQFKGTAQDYAVASLVFHSIVERRGLRALMQVYELMAKNRTGFPTALKEALGWDGNRVNKEIQSVLSGY